MFTAAGRPLLVLLAALALDTGAVAAARMTTFVAQASVPVECGVALDAKVRAASADSANAGSTVTTTCGNAAPCKVETRRIEGSASDAGEPDRRPARDAASSAVMVTITF
jgi:hypothetical protein